MNGWSSSYLFNSRKHVKPAFKKGDIDGILSTCANIVLMFNVEMDLNPSILNLQWLAAAWIFSVRPSRPMQLISDVPILRAVTHQSAIGQFVEPLFRERFR